MNPTDLIIVLFVVMLVGLVLYLVINHQRLLEAHCVLQGKFDMLLAQAQEQFDRARERSTSSTTRIAAEERRQIPPVLISREVLHELADGINRDRRIHPGVEHGYALVGRIDGEGERRRIIVNGLIEAGEAAQKFCCEIRFDRAFQQSELLKLQLIDPRASHIGDAHLHPGSMDHCSGGDFRTDRANVTASKTKEMVFCIATAVREHSSVGRDAMSCYVDGLKLDFFYMGEASRFKYEKIKPREIDEPALVIPAAMKQLLRRDSQRAYLDCASLISLEQFKVLFTQMNDLPSVQLEHRDDNWRAMIILGESDDSPPTVFIEHGPDIEKFEAPLIVEKWTPHLWLSAIALAIDEYMSDRSSAQCSEPSIAARAGTFNGESRIGRRDTFE